MATATKKKSSSKIKLQPLGDRVVVERESSESTTSGGIVLPDSAQDKPARGKIISVGDGKLLDDGRRSEMQVKVGDRVVFSSYAGESFEVDDQELLPDGRKLPYWVEDEVRAVGANWDAELDADTSVHVDGDLITGRGPESSHAAAETLLDELGVA